MALNLNKIPSMRHWLSHMLHLLSYYRWHKLIIVEISPPIDKLYVTQKVRQKYEGVFDIVIFYSWCAQFKHLEELLWSGIFPIVVIHSNISANHFTNFFTSKQNQFPHNNNQIAVSELIDDISIFMNDSLDVGYYRKYSEFCAIPINLE